MNWTNGFLFLTLPTNDFTWNILRQLACTFFDETYRREFSTDVSFSILDSRSFHHRDTLRRCVLRSSGQFFSVNKYIRESIYSQRCNAMPGSCSLFIVQHPSQYIATFHERWNKLATSRGHATASARQRFFLFCSTLLSGAILHEQEMKLCRCNRVLGAYGPLQSLLKYFMVTRD